MAEKYLKSFHWCNDSEGPVKLSMLFIVPNSLLDDGNGLFLKLKMAEGKGFTDESVHSLLKKDHYIPIGPL